MKYKSVFIIIAISLVYDALGFLFEYAHYQIGVITGKELLLVSLSLKVISVLILIKVYFKSKSNEPIS